MRLVGNSRMLNLPPSQILPVSFTEILINPLFEPKSLKFAASYLVKIPS